MQVRIYPPLTLPETIRRLAITSFIELSFLVSPPFEVGPPSSWVFGYRITNREDGKDNSPGMLNDCALFIRSERKRERSGSRRIRVLPEKTIIFVVFLTLPKLLVVNY